MLASRTFTMADQIRFATVSGDHNPMHMDGVFARLYSGRRAGGAWHPSTTLGIRCAGTGQ